MSHPQLDEQSGINKYTYGDSCVVYMVCTGLEYIGILMELMRACLESFQREKAHIWRTAKVDTDGRIVVWTLKILTHSMPPYF